MRWTILFLSCFTLFSNQYAFVNPDSIQLQIMKAFKIDFFHFNILQAMVSLPNILVCIIAGFVMDAVGPAKASVCFVMITLVGQVLFALAPYTADFDMALAGRALFGVGSECQSIWFNTLVTIWFFYTEGCTASASGQAIGKAGGFLAGVLTPFIYEQFGDIQSTFWFSLGLTILMIPMVAVANYYDLENHKRRKRFHLIR